MNKFIALASIVTLVSLSVIVYVQNNNKSDSFTEWKQKFGTPFDVSEQVYRRLIFERNLQRIEKHNADPTQTYKMGVTQFSIYTDEQFKLRFLTEMITPESDQILKVDEDYELPGAVDWVAQGKVSRVKNQGSCGACWAFSTTGVCESFSLIKGNPINLSEQQLIDCAQSYGNHGCTGGLTSNAFKYILNNGLSSQDEYPYIGKDQTCKKNGGSFKISNILTVPRGCAELTNAITGRPLSIVVDASNWSHYTGGVFANCGGSINHAVLLVGVDTSGNWKVKNSWGTTWGEQGYIRLAPANTCGICQYGGVYVQ